MAEGRGTNARWEAPPGGTRVVYPGKDLEAMSFAVNYHRWILDLLAPHLGRRLVEVGAGSGSFSELLLERGPESLLLIEPSKEMYALLQERLGRPDARGRASALNATFGQVADRLREGRRPDSVIYVNVLEHVLDDVGELAAVHRALGAGGRVFVFVPALRWLHGSFDERIGHHRRYSKAELEEKCRRAGFRVLESRYFDVVGIAPWWVKYRLLRSNAMEPGAVEFYDRYVVPVSRAVESAVEPPIGKNVLLVAEKP